MWEEFTSSIIYPTFIGIDEGTTEKTPEILKCCERIREKTVLCEKLDLDVSRLGFEEELYLKPLNTTLTFTGTVGGESTETFRYKYKDLTFTITHGINTEGAYGYGHREDGRHYRILYCDNGFHVLGEYKASKPIYH